MPPIQPGDPRTVGPYRVTARLGAGGMGQVLLGRSPGGRDVAIKLIHPALADDPGFRARFRREIEAARAVNGVYTAPIVDADPDAPQPWLATTFLPGMSLQDAVAVHGPLPPPAVRALGAGLAEALVAIHRAGIVHRDLKPSNVMLTPEGPRVIDFGIARASDASALTQTGAAVGTPAYMGPEQAAGESPGPPGDVFSLGAVLTYAAMGVGPFGHAAVHEMVYRVIHLPPDLRGVIDLWLRGLIAACLDKDPARRPTAEQLLRSLAVPQIGSPFGTQWLPPPVAYDIAHRGGATARSGPSRRRFLIIGAAGGAVVAGAAVAGGVGLARARERSKVRWSFKLPDEMSVMTGPAALSGTVYAGGRSGFSTQTFALDSRTGKLRWSGGFSPALNTVPVVSGGRGFVCDGGGAKGSVASFDVATGQTRWTTPIGSFAYAPALVVTGDVVCIAGSDDVGSYGVYAFDAARGDRRWHYRTDDMIQGNVTLSGGLLYFGSGNDGFLYAVDAATGGGRWQQHVGDVSEVTPVVQEGVMVIAAPDYTIRAFDPATGRQRWKVALGAAGSVGEGVTPLVAGGTVYVGRAGTLHALDAATGRTRWTFAAGRAKTSGGSNGLLPVVRGGLAVLSNDDRAVYALDAATGKVRWQRTVATTLGNRPLLLGNTVYQAAFDGVHGFDVTTGRPVFLVGESDFPPELGASSDNLGTEDGLLFCCIGSTTICAVAP